MANDTRTQPERSKNNHNSVDSEDMISEISCRKKTKTKKIIATTILLLLFSNASRVVQNYYARVNNTISYCYYHQQQHQNLTPFSSAQNKLVMVVF